MQVVCLAAPAECWRAVKEKRKRGEVGENVKGSAHRDNQNESGRDTTLVGTNASSQQGYMCLGSRLAAHIS